MQCPWMTFGASLGARRLRLRRARPVLQRTFHRLVEGHGADVSYQQVLRYVADRKPRILIESGKALPRINA